MLALPVPGVAMGCGAAATPPVRGFRRLAARRGALTLRARRGVALALRSARRTTFNMRSAARMSVTQNLRFFRGEDVTLDFQMTPPEDVTGWTIVFKLADKLGGTVQFSKTATVVDGPRGRYTAGLAVGRYVWDARRTDAGSKATLADGFLDLAQEVAA
jgi:hypothetical protein